MKVDNPEAELRAALDDGDPQRIDAAETAYLRAIDDGNTSPSLPASALWYAQHGLRVFPLTPGSKIPRRGSRGCKDATTNPATIRAWWDAEPAANIGIATGGPYDVVDIDGPQGQRTRATHWDDTFATIDADCVGKVLTPRPGGMHLYVPATGDGNRAAIFPGIDYRGAGGYVVAPPSRLDNSGLYRWLGTPTLGGA